MFIDFAVYLISLKDGDESQGMGGVKRVERRGKAKETNKSSRYVVSKDIGNLAQISKAQDKCVEKEIASGRKRTTQFGAPYRPMTGEMSVRANEDGKSDALAMTDLEKTYEQNRESVYFPSPYATSRVPGLHRDEVGLERDGCRSLHHHSGRQSDHLYDIPQQMRDDMVS
ncbi:down syndrome cell adhesion molecule [Caerostris darwini]|uniref:Down syndrome cell adhesion molecule n=1 Tax=Caerostris darwini TaxID=1538125 RepID=A0AAV4Q0C1_9ARAC|nr:down syndrome cell adhesion molecule [Caerostris darwini]